MPPSTTAWTRKPSHLISNSQSSSSNGLGREGREHRLDLARQRRGLGTGEVDLGDGRRRLADPDRVAVLLDLVVRAAGLDALRVVFGIPARRGGLVVLVDEQPLVAVIALEGPARPAPAGPHDREAALELLAVETELELAVLDALAPVECRGLGLPGAPVPDDDVARAVLLGRDDSFEIEVFDRMVLDVDGHAADLRVERRALRHGPRHEDAVDLETEVVVEPRRAVALDDEPAGATAGGGRRDGRRLRSLFEVPLAAVFLERHRRVSLTRFPGDACLYLRDAIQYRLKRQNLHGETVMATARPVHGGFGV